MVAQAAMSPTSRSNVMIENQFMTGEIFSVLRTKSVVLRVRQSRFILQNLGEVMSDLSKSQQKERDLLIACTAPVALEVVSDLRLYRQAAMWLLSARYRDGECDGATLSRFCGIIEDIEDGENPQVPETCSE